MPDEGPLTLAAQILADPSPASEALNQFRAQTDQFVEQTMGGFQAANDSVKKNVADLKFQIASVTQGMNALNIQLGRAQDPTFITNATTRIREMQVEVGGLQGRLEALQAPISQTGKAFTETFTGARATASLLSRDLGLRMPQALTTIIGHLQGIGPLMSAAFGASIIIFAGEQIFRVGKAVAHLIEEYTGLDDEAKKAYHEVVQASDDALSHFQGLTTEAKIATANFLIAQTEQRIQADILTRTAIADRAYWSELKEEMRGVAELAVNNNKVDLALFAAQFASKRAATTDEMQQNVLLQKQMKELAELEKERAREEAEDEKARRRTAKEAEAAAEKRAKAIQHVTDTLSDLIQKEKDEADALEVAAAGGNKAREIELSYQSEIRLINERVRAAKEAGTLTVQAEQEADEAKLLARANYLEKLRQLGEQERAELDKESAEFQKQGQASYFKEHLREDEEALKSADARAKEFLRTMKELGTALREGGSFAGVDLNPLNATFAQFNQRLREASQLSGIAIQPISRLTFELGRLRAAAEKVGLTVTEFSQAMGTSIGHAIVYGESIKKAMEQALKAEAASIAGRAFMWGLYYTAHGIADVFWNPPRAGADFESAAEFFAIGGVAAGLGAAIPAGAGRPSQIRGPGASSGYGAGSSYSAAGSFTGGEAPGSTGYVSPSALAPGSRPAPQMLHVTLFMNGNQFAEAVIPSLNSAVARGVTLNASSAASVPPSAG